MKFTPTGRFVYKVQWYAAVILTVFAALSIAAGAIFGDSWSDERVREMILLYLLIVMAAACVPPFLTALDADARQAESVRSAVVPATIITWVSLICLAIVFPDDGQDRLYPSLMEETSGSMRATLLSLMISLAAGLTGSIAWLVATLVASGGVRRSKREAIES